MQMPSDLERPQYKVYRSGPRGLRSLLRGEEPIDLGGPARRRRPRRACLRLAGAGASASRVKRVILYLAGLLVFWLLLSFVLFMISAGTNSSSLPPAREL